MLTKKIVFVFFVIAAILSVFIIVIKTKNNTPIAESANKVEENKQAAKSGETNCGNGICETSKNEKICSKDCCNSLLYQCLSTSLKDCEAKGWKEITIDINGMPRKILWKGPQGAWRNGAIIALHGGGGMHTNFCGNVFLNDKSSANLINKLNAPMVDFANSAIKNGFAVFALDSTYNQVSDSQNRPAGKRWDSVVQDNKKNIDLSFIEKTIIETIPGLMPKNSVQGIFLTGISNGGFMSILAATNFPDKITAFAPVSAGDPYGAYFDMGAHPDNERPCAPGVWKDNGTNKDLSRQNACAAKKLTNEKKWPITKTTKPAFKQFHHEGDAACDISCMKKVEKLLVDNGYKNEKPFIIKKRFFWGRSAQNHFWQSEYNIPMLKFFEKLNKK